MADDELARLNGALAGMRKALDTPMPPRVIRLVAQYDQIASELRDMDSGERQEATESIAAELGISFEEAADWVKRLLEKD